MAVFFDFLELVLDESPHSAPVNMAIDEVLLHEITTPLLRFYRWQRRSVSFGYFEAYAPIRAAYPDRQPVRRWTGGGVVLHGEDLTFSLIVPRSDRFLQMPTAQSYRTVHEEIAQILQQEGLGAQVAPTPAPKISQACFENAAQFDLVLESRKIVGGAQRRNRFGLLHQGSIQALELPSDFPGRLGRALCKEPAQRHLRDSELAAAEELSENKYASPGWLNKF